MYRLGFSRDTAPFSGTGTATTPIPKNPILRAIGPPSFPRQNESCHYKPTESARRFESQSFWEPSRQLPWPTSLQLWCRLPRRRCVIAIATMEPGPSNARRCASCRNTRIAGGRPLATKRARCETGGGTGFKLALAQDERHRRSSPIGSQSNSFPGPPFVFGVFLP